MWALPATLLLLHIAHLSSAECSSTKVNNNLLNLEMLNNSSKCVNASNKNITKIEGKLPQSITKLDLSHNKLQEIPQEFLNSIPNLQELYLNDNELKQFPSKFSSNSLKLLRLEGNQLSSLLTNDFPKSLRNLSVDCECELVNTTLVHCGNDCVLNIECRKSSDTGLTNAQEFYNQECGKQKTATKPILIAIVVSILTLLLVACVAYVLIRRKKKGATFGQDKRASNASDATHGQPRYHTHSGPQDPGTGQHANYENVFIDQPQEARGGSNDHRAQRQSKSRLPSSAEKANNSLAEQPIYANTQDVYYNYSGQTASEAPDEEVYIMPDQ
ncbi:uncharacterized protein [Tiliqua scincoides]|uniref:uncharacterized protein n=1 Tax=Tiliqua scincoides TaxID=71010 RepID=UPI00346190B2